MMDTPKVQILMATYNGERFLQEQLDSIATQTYQNWEILARDDGSSDNTVDILKRFQTAHPDKVKIIEDGLGNSGGAAKNFILLLGKADAPVLAFADQDDIWFPEKLARSVEKLASLEATYGAQTPLMVHHDFALIDQNKKVLCDSFDAANGKQREINTPERMPFRGYAHGFSMTVNKALVDKTLPAPYTQGHDVLLACVAEDFGHIEYIPKQLALYRRHDANVSAIHSYPRRVLKSVFSGDLNTSEIFSRLNNAFDRAHDNLREKCHATGAYLERFGNDLPPDRQERLKKFAEIESLGTLERKMLLFKYSAESVQTRLVASLAL